MGSSRDGSGTHLEMRSSRDAWVARLEMVGSSQDDPPGRLEMGSSRDGLEVHLEMGSHLEMGQGPVSR